jgi:hypothetical protein
MSEGSNFWTPAAVGIDHKSEIVLTTYKTNTSMGQVLGLDKLGCIVFSNRTIPALIHFNGPKEEKEVQTAYTKANFPLLIKARLTSSTCEAESGRCALEAPSSAIQAPVPAYKVCCYVPRFATQGHQLYPFIERIIKILNPKKPFTSISRGACMHWPL